MGRGGMGAELRWASRPAWGCCVLAVSGGWESDFLVRNECFMGLEMGVCC